MIVGRVVMAGYGNWYIVNMVMVVTVCVGMAILFFRTAIVNVCCFMVVVVLVGL